ncbi:MAG: cadherin-like beta sandwich domain-containing protein [Firmicutes bacterium]|nr:cadherin-like beta sandwich domain-containing protein [Bacillota bacterium]
MKKFLAVLLALVMVLAVSGAAMAASDWDVTAGSNTQVEVGANSATAYFRFAGSGAQYTVTHQITNNSNNTADFALGTSENDRGASVSVPAGRSAEISYTVDSPTMDNKTFKAYLSDGDGNWDQFENGFYTVYAKEATRASFVNFEFTSTKGNFDTAYRTLTLSPSDTGAFDITADAHSANLVINYKIGNGSYDTGNNKGSVTARNIDVPNINATNTVTFRVTNEAGEQAEHTITIDHPSNARLSALRVEGVSTGTRYINETNPASSLSATTKADKNVYVTASVADPMQYEIKIGGTTVTSGSPKQYAIGDTASGTTLNITVTNRANSSDTRSYTVKLVMAKAVDLYALDVALDEAGKKPLDLYRNSSLSSSYKGFRATTYDYWLDDSEIDDKDDLYILVELSSRADERTFDVDVHSKDRIREVDDYVWRVTTTGEDITVTISAEGYQDTVYTLHQKGSSSTGKLEDLAIYNGENTTSKKNLLDMYPTFASTVADYYVFIPYDRNDEPYVTVLATVANKTDYLKINNTEKASNTDELQVSVPVGFGDGKEITITAGDSKYTVKVFRAERNADDDLGLSVMKLYTDANLTAANEVTLTAGSTSGNVKKYTATVPASQTNVWLNTKAQHNSSYVLVNGKMVSEQTTAAKTTKIELNKTGTTTITVVNMAEDCETEQRYEIVVSKGVTDALLRSLILSTATNTLNYSPVFNSNTVYYCTNVPYADSVIYFTPTTNATGSTIKINNAAVSNAVRSAAFNVSVGQNTFDITVTSAAGVDKHYYVNVLRQTQTPVIKVTKQRLSVNGGASQALAAYNIDGYNYLKLRDVAKLLSGTTKQFNVGYDAATRLVTMTTGVPYVSVGGELQIPTAYKAAKVSPQIIRMNGQNVYPMAYNIDGYNYFLMRDLALLLDCDIQYDANTATVNLNTNKAFAN